MTISNLRPILTVFALLVAGLVRADWPTSIMADDGRQMIGYSVATDRTGAVYMVGTTDFFVGETEELFVTKFSAAGDVLWKKSYGLNLEGRGIAIDDDNNIYVLAATKIAFKNKRNMTNQLVTMMLTQQGKVLWRKTIDRPNFRTYYPAKLIAVPGDGCILMATTSDRRVRDYEVLIARYGMKGGRRWLSLIAKPGYIEYSDLVVDRHGNPTALFASNTGYNWDYATFAATVISLDANGTEKWRRQVLGSGDVYTDIGEKFPLAIDSKDRIIVGHSQLEAGKEGLVISQFAPDGTQLWETTTGVPGLEESADRLAVDAHDNILVSGKTVIQADESQHGLCLAKLDSSGQVQWALPFQTRGKDDEYTLVGLIVDQDGASYIGGSRANPWYKDRAFTVLKVRADGTTEWYREDASMPDSEDAKARAMTYDRRHRSLYVTGQSDALPWGVAAYTVKY